MTMLFFAQTIREIKVNDVCNRPGSPLQGCSVSPMREWLPLISAATHDCSLRKLALADLQYCALRAQRFPDR
jgi:hypothetical protein